MKSAARPTRVAVIGAGPAGATVACLLARKGASAVILDDGKRPEMIVGESLVPMLVPIFRRLGIEEEVRKIGIVKPGVTVTFNGESEIRLFFTAARGVLPTYAYNVPRREFDDLVVRTAEADGVRVAKGAVKVEAGNGNTVRLSPESLALIPEWGGEPPDMLIDASGRRRLFAKALGIEAVIGKRKDVSHFAHYENCPWPEPRGQVMTMRLQEGWGWRIPLPPDKLSLGVVINKEHAQKYGNTPEEQLEGIMDNDPRVRGECGQRRRVTPVTTYANYQLISKTGGGPGWATVGDSFGFVDPLLSPGLCMAMLSAEKLAAIIPATGGVGPAVDAKVDTYIEWFRDNLKAWQSLIDYFYDGRLFALQSTGMHYMKKYPNPLFNIMQRHIEKNLSSMASGAYIDRPYSKWLLSFMIRRGIRGYDPKDFSIR